MTDEEWTLIAPGKFNLGQEVKLKQEFHFSNERVIINTLEEFKPVSTKIVGIIDTTPREYLLWFGNDSFPFTVQLRVKEDEIE